ncbi:GNAT family N-acetyltransferase [Bifidobacterium thermophilum]|nr:GNAT family N-acetyltransferase [Bifidobacterium thermophilum]
MGAIRDHIHHAKASSRNHTDGAHTENRSRSSIQRSPQAVVPLQTTRSHAKPAVSAALMPKTSSDAATAGGSVVIYRPLTATDLPAIIDEYDQTWGFRPLSERRPLSQMVSKRFVMHYLEGTTRAEVAELDGQVLGLTFAQVDGERPLYPHAQETLAGIDDRLRADDTGSVALRETLYWHRAENRLERISQIGKVTQAELRLFLVSSKARGHGVGGGLWRRLMAYFQACGVKRYFLHTDNSCNVGFYDHQGLVCNAKRIAADHPEDHVEKMYGRMNDLYIYSGEPSRTVRHRRRGGNSGAGQQPKRGE